MVATVPAAPPFVPIVRLLAWLNENESFAFQLPPPAIFVTGLPSERLAFPPPVVI